MPIKLPSASTAVFASALLLGLSGCVAAIPLGQMAVSQMAPTQIPCATGAGCQAGGSGGALGDISKGLSASFANLTGGHKVADAPVK
jgi:hypothetical protein